MVGRVSVVFVYCLISRFIFFVLIIFVCLWSFCFFLFFEGNCLTKSYLKFKSPLPGEIKRPWYFDRAKVAKSLVFLIVNLYEWGIFLFFCFFSEFILLLKITVFPIRREDPGSFIFSLEFQRRFLVGVIVYCCIIIRCRFFLNFFFW